MHRIAEKRSLAMLLVVMIMSTTMSLAYAGISISSRMTVDADAASWPGVSIVQGQSATINLTISAGRGLFGNISGKLTLPADYFIHNDGIITARGDELANFEFDGVSGQSVTHRLTVFADEDAPVGTTELVLYQLTNQPGAREQGFIITDGSISSDLQFDISALRLYVNVLPQPTYDLELATSPAAGGSATIIDQAVPVRYRAGAVVAIKAEPAEGYRFRGWYSDTGSFEQKENAETTFTMPDRPAKVTAYFVRIPEKKKIIEVALFNPEPEEEQIQSEIKLKIDDQDFEPKPKPGTKIKDDSVILDVQDGPPAPSAPAVANALLREKYPDIKPNSKDFKNIIKQVTEHMGDEQGHGTDFNDIPKEDKEAYQIAVEDYLEDIGAFG